MSIPLWVDAISVWCEAVRGEVPFDAALARVLTASKGEAAMLVRRRAWPGRHELIARCDWREGQTNSLSTTFGNEIFGEDLARARGSSVWVQSVYNPAGTEALREFHFSRDLKDFAVLVLSPGFMESYHLELHFRHVLSPMAIDIMTEALGVLSRNWKSHVRTKGSGSNILGNDVGEGSYLENSKTLSDANPLGLTKAEFRVCFELSQGRSVHRLCAELNLAPSTLKAHLRSIYGKTDTSNLVELIFLLNGGAAAEARTPKGIANLSERG
ncbi:LuxR C-terminal-related transcriptional regulator [Solirhodobacter olei]|uniref:LuxR C-terminal-related transcriptional regulator n=1 Tax=Solirhodobacter olei TaxID=2493082 RepID=UPI000FDC23FC|nr:LuxR C-terminal-related transcriptional regulator [Solirhodobacter olei]